MPSLNDKWGGKEIWLRALYLRANVIWIFRQELLELELGRLQWLKRILDDAYLNINVQASRFGTNKEGFDFCLELIRNNIGQRIELAPIDAELQRLLQLAQVAQPCDVIERVFRPLAGEAAAVHRAAPHRTVRLSREWLNTHPLGSARPGDYRDPYHVDALTVIQKELSTVELQAHLDEFDALSLLAIPALFTHELVCHAYANDKRSNQKSIWAEGVMDWTAAHFFGKWIRRLNFPYAAVKNRGHDLWDRRMSSTRSSGRMIADTLVDWLAGEPSVQVLQVAESVAAHYTLEVNVAAEPLWAKDELASRIANIRTDEPLQEALRDWLTGGRSAAATVHH
jgi:hypothetical protein